MTNKTHSIEVSRWLAQYVRDILIFEMDAQDDLDPEARLSLLRLNEVSLFLEKLDQIASRYGD